MVGPAGFTVMPSAVGTFSRARAIWASVRAGNLTPTGVWPGGSQAKSGSLAHSACPAALAAGFTGSMYQVPSGAGGLVRYFTASATASLTW